jgi:hypothetical protein
MPGALKHPRKGAVIRGKLWRYTAYAIGEIVLIFIGITLAVAFQNVNDRRRVADLERDILSTVEDNLMANIDMLNRNISVDELVVGAIDTVLTQLRSDRVWPDSLNGSLRASFFWSSPFFSTSGYENLNQLGLHLVSDSELRSQLVRLHERTYAFLTGDVDRAMWSKQQSILEPLVAAEIEVVDESVTIAGFPLEGTFKPRNYEASVRRGNLEFALAAQRSRLLSGINSRRAAIDETEEILRLVRGFLEDQ